MLSHGGRAFSIARRAKTEEPRASALGTLTLGIRPERAADCRLLFTKTTIVERDSTLTPFQGDSVVRVLPRPKGLGYFLFALRATVQRPNSINRRRASV